MRSSRHTNVPSFQSSPHSTPLRSQWDYSTLKAAWPFTPLSVCVVRVSTYHLPGAQFAIRRNGTALSSNAHAFQLECGEDLIDCMRQSRTVSSLSLQVQLWSIEGFDKDFSARISNSSGTAGHSTR